MIFDVGNVLIYFDAQRMLRQVSDVLGIGEMQAIDLYVHQELGIQYERGSISSAEFYRRFSQLSKKPHRQDMFWNAFSDIFQPNMEMEKLVKELKMQGRRLILLSNTCEAHYHYFHPKFEIFAAFDQSILSHEVGARKPEREIFEAALKAAGCSPEQCFYTDDITAYVAAARELNIPAEPFTTAQKLREDLRRLDIL